MTVKRVTATILCIFFLFTGVSAFLIFLLPHSFSEGKHFLMTKWVVLFLLSAGIFTGLVASKKKTRKLSFTEQTNNINGLLGILFVLIGGALGALSIFASPTGGDEGMWTNVIRNLLLYSHYALGQPGSFQDFAPSISVGPTVILPLTVLYKWIPAGLVVFRIYALGWFLATLTMIYFLYASLLKGWRLLLVLIFFFFFLYNPAIQAVYSSVMGEMPALFFLIAGLLFLPHQLFLSGFFFGVAIVTKLTLILILILPFIFILFGFVEGWRIQPRSILIFWGGVLLPLLPWFLVRALLNNIPVNQNIQTLLDFLLLGVGNPLKRILQYGLDNFFKLVFLFSAATLFLKKALDTGRITVQELSMYAFSLFLILWFFSCTDGHFARYMTYPIFLLIPLAVKTFPENPPSQLTRKLISMILFFLFLFHSEMGNLIKTFSSPRHRLPWISDQLKVRLRNFKPVIWTVDQFDGYYLSLLMDPPVFWVREEMFFENHGPQSHPTPINIKTAQKENKFVLPSIRMGDLLAVGVSKNEMEERKLYLLKFTQIPKSKTNRFVLSKNIPAELKTTLTQRLEWLGLTGTEEKMNPNENAYRLEFWEPRPGLAE